MKVYRMQDISAPDTKVDHGLRFSKVYEMTDYTDDELDAITSLQVDEELLLDKGHIWIRRDA